MLRPKGYFHNDYCETVDLSITNSFATAALRYGHSTVGNFYERTGADSLDVADFHNPDPLYEDGGIDGLLGGMLEQPAKEIDR